MSWLRWVWRYKILRRPVPRITDRQIFEKALEIHRETVAAAGGRLKVREPVEYKETWT